MNDNLMQTYARQPVAFTHGEGSWLWDTNGNKYLDALSGIAVCNLGHAYPAISNVISEQAKKLLHTSNLYQMPIQAELATKLCSISNMDRAFFCNSGAEANEAAIKMARLYGNSKKITVPTIVVMENSFHGRTMATLTATGNRKVHSGFEPLVCGFLRDPYNNIEALKATTENNEDVVAVMLEPIQGEGGVVIPDADYLQQVRDICDEHEWLMIVDEVQTGIGRTGSWFGFQNSSIDDRQQAVQPDIITVAKALGNGVPIGATLARGDAAELFKPGHHGSTFGGNQLVTQVALSVVNSIESEDLLARAKVAGNSILEKLADYLQDNPAVVDIRGKGMIIGVELDRSCGEIVALAREAGVLLNVTADNVVRLLPPLVVSDEEIDLLTKKLSAIINNFTSIEDANLGEIEAAVVSGDMS